MTRTARPVMATILGAALVTGIAGCDNLPDIDPSRLPDISFSPGGGGDDPDPQPTETVTEEPEPAPTETVTEDPEPEPEPTEEPAEEGEPVLWWPWALAAVVLLILIIVWARHRSVRKDWDRKLDKARSEVSWFEDSLVPQILGKSTAAEAAAMWRSAEPRVLEIDRQLHALSETQLGEERARRATQGLEALRALAAAVDSEASTQAGTDADQLRARRAAIDSARAQVRQWVSAGQR